VKPDGLLWRDVTVEHLAPGGETDEYGNPIDTVRVSGVFKGYAWLVKDDERTVAGDVTTQEWRLVLEANAGRRIGSPDRVTVEGDRFEVIGLPWIVTNPRAKGSVSHVEVTIRRSDG